MKAKYPSETPSVLKDKYLHKPLPSRRERLRYFVDGVVLGSEEFVRDYLQMLKKEGYYLRRKNPIPQLPGPYATLREQRSHAATW